VELCGHVQQVACSEEPSQKKCSVLVQVPIESECSHGLKSLVPCNSKLLSGKNEITFCLCYVKANCSH